ncbi:Enoyl-[acyl-carrier-protein] reductase [FMN] [hydrothermal vent metagenome]|uniref:Enoyl-[acyl-carrier-protein] reductase [FMN] n=1 Tax=hydrothermal vent metagenome TaxID=652676 RepID=A0A3B0RBN8_9ZZZZ
MDKSGQERLAALWQRGKDFLGVEYAILGGAMSWLSERHLVSAISNAGGFGVIACGSMTPDLLDSEITATKAMTNKPFAVNLITMHPMISDLIDVCLNQKVTHVVLAGGIPAAADIKRLKDGGAKVICFAPALILAKKLIRSGADAIVVEGSEAGGHIGPVSTSVLAQEILLHVTDVPVFVAGGIGRGEVMASYLEMGAAGVQLGTLFVCATESIAHENFKKAFIRGNSRDAITSVQLDPRFPVIPVRALKNKASEAFQQAQRDVIARYQGGEMDMKEAQLAIEHYWAGALRKAVIDGDVEGGSLMAGQIVGMVKQEQSTQDIIDGLVEQAVDYLSVP